MSFQIKDKKKLALFRKCVQILTHEKEDFYMHFTKTHIRLFNMFKDDSTYMIDFQAPWFSKFMAPDLILNDELEILQVRMAREVFLQSFTLHDDTEVEMMLLFQPNPESGSTQFGKLKLLKTRDLYIIEAHVLFDIDSEIQCDESYNFPDEHLLISTPARHLKPLKPLFSKNSKQEVLQLQFETQGNDPKLTFKGSLNQKFDYEIKKKQLGLQVLGAYLDNGYGRAQQFKLSLGLKHLLSLVKICDLVENGGSGGGGQAMAAMEQSGDASAVCFLFTDGLSGEFRFIIGVGNVRFERQDDSKQDTSRPQPLSDSQRLRKANDGGRGRGNQDATENILSQLPVKVEARPKQESKEVEKKSGIPAESSEAPTVEKPDAEMTEEKTTENREQNKERQEFYKKVDAEEFF